MSFAESFEIAGRPVGPGYPTYIVAEVGQAHDGSLGTAHAYIDAAAEAGADAIKFQTHIASAESTPGEPFRVKFSKQDATRYDYWQRMEFTVDQWRGLADHAREAKLCFLSSAFSPAAVELLRGLDHAAWKVGSGEVTNLPLIEMMAQTGRPVLLSSGMSTWQELDDAAGAAAAVGAPVATLQCTTSYPCPPDKIGLNVIGELRSRYGCPVGLSDHSGTIYPSLAATALGADLLEVHIVFSRGCFGPDTPASVTVAELKQLVEGARFIDAALASPIDKEAAARDLLELKRLFEKSIVLAEDRPAGHVLALDDLRTKKPGTGIPARRLREMVGRRLARAVSADALLAEEDLS